MRKAFSKLTALAAIAALFAIFAACSDDDGYSISQAEIDLDRIREVRAQLPTFLHLREDVYSIPAPVKKP